MDLPFISRGAKRRDQVLAIDLGSRTTKAVQLQRRGERLSLVNYALMDAPLSEKSLSTDVLADHLMTMHKALGGGRARQVTLSVGVSDSLFRQVEAPLMPLADLRLMLKFNSKTYLQQDLPDYVFDCYYRPSSPKSQEPLKPDAPRPAVQKQKVMVTGARKPFIDDLQQAAKQAGLIAEEVVPGLIGPVNAFELAEPEIFAKEVVALVDIGFKNTTIMILDCGELILNRVLALGGDRITSGLAESIGISYAEAENIKVGMPVEVQQNLEPILNPLGRELRASIDFFEHQQDRTVSQVFISGGSARSEFMIETLQTELVLPCKSWNPARSFELALPPQKMGEIEQVAPQLTVAIGAAVSVF